MDFLQLCKHLQSGSNAVLCLFVGILCNCVKFACATHKIVGVCLGLGHFLKLAHHDFFHSVGKFGKATCHGFVGRDNKFFQLLLVNVGVQIVLNSNVFHSELLKNKFDGTIIPHNWQNAIAW